MEASQTQPSRPAEAGSGSFTSEDPFENPLDKAYVREAKIHLAILGILATVFFGVAYYKLSGAGQTVPDLVMNHPVFPEEVVLDEKTGQGPLLPGNPSAPPVDSERWAATGSSSTRGENGDELMSGQDAPYPRVARLEEPTVPAQAKGRMESGHFLPSVREDLQTRGNSPQQPEISLPLRPQGVESNLDHDPANSGGFVPPSMILPGKMARPADRQEITPPVDTIDRQPETSEPARQPGRFRPSSGVGELSKNSLRDNVDMPEKKSNIDAPVELNRQESNPLMASRIPHELGGDGVDSIEKASAANDNPADENPADAKSVASKNVPEIVTVEGDSFFTIAQQVYGDAKWFSLLYEFNRARVGDSVELKPGTRIATPPLESLREAVENRKATRPVDTLDKPFALTVPGNRVYQSTGKESLFDIARDQLGNASRFDEIIRLNRQRLPQGANQTTILNPKTPIELPAK